MLNPVWSRNGRQLYFLSNQGEKQGIMVKPVDGSRNEELIFASNRPLYPISVSPDGKRFIMVRNTGYNSSTTTFNVILNWDKELAARFEGQD